MGPPEDLQQAIKAAVAEAVRGTEWEPPDGSILVDCVVVMGWYTLDGSHGSSHLVCGAPWAGRGLIDQAQQRIEGEYDNDIDDDG